MASTKKAAPKVVKKTTSKKGRKFPAAHPPEDKARAIELALKVGAAKAAQETGLKPKTVEGWLTAARKKLNVSGGTKATTSAKKQPKKAAPPKAPAQARSVARGFTADIAGQITARIAELEGELSGLRTALRALSR